MSNTLKRIAGPVVAVRADATVHEAVRTMVTHRIGAVIVLDGDRMAGIFSERDILEKVVLARRDATTTPVSAVMSSPVVSAPAGADEEQATDTMVEHHIRHLPILDEKRRVVGMLSLRHAMRERIDDLQHEVNALEAYLGYDGVSG